MAVALYAPAPCKWPPFPLMSTPESDYTHNIQLLRLFSKPLRVQY